MDLPNLSDTVTAAIIAGAFALIGQSAVKVWEIRQRRRDEIARIYAGRLKTVRMSAEAAIRMAIAREWVSLRSDMVDRRRPLNLMGKRLSASLDPSAEDERYAEAKLQLERSRETLRKRGDEYNAAKDQLLDTDSIFLLYARPPLRNANLQLEEVLDAVESDRARDADVAGAAALFARVAQWELVATGSIGLPWIGYSLFSLCVSISNFAVKRQGILNQKAGLDATVEEEVPPGPGGQGKTESESEPQEVETDGSEHDSEPGSPAGDRK